MKVRDNFDDVHAYQETHNWQELSRQTPTNREGLARLGYDMMQKGNLFFGVQGHAYLAIYHHLSIFPSWWIKFHPHALALTKCACVRARV